MCAEDALTKLLYNRSALESSLERAQKLEHWISYLEQELAKSLLKDQRLLEWMMDPDSTCLFNNGVIRGEKIEYKELAFTFATSTGEPVTPFKWWTVCANYFFNQVVSLLYQWPSNSITVLYAFGKPGVQGVSAPSSIFGLLPGLICQLLDRKRNLEISGDVVPHLR